MPTYHVMLAVPEHIHTGLQSGELVRNAAGVIRYATGSKKGHIVAHLREAAQASLQEGVQASSLQQGILACNVASIALQATTLAYLHAKLDALERQLTQVLTVSQDTYEIVRQIHDFQYLEYATMWVRGFEALRRVQDGGGRHHLEDACRAFRDAVADMKRLLMTHDGEQLLGNARQVELLLRLAAVGAAAELQALAMMNAPGGERQATLRAHRQFWSEFVARLERIPPPTQRIPTDKMLRDRMGYLKRQQCWQSEATTLIETFDVEEFLLEVAATRPQQLEAWTHRAAEGGNHTCLLVKEDAPKRGE